MLDLLPHNATDQERALDLTTARIADVPLPVRSLWSPDDCPVALLPWLAWALSVDQWDAGWTDEQKRATVRTAIEVQRIKGTIGAVRAALQALGIEVSVLEWHRQETPGDPYTYQLLFDVRQFPARAADIDVVVGAVDRTKSLRSHLETVEISAVSEASPFAGVVALSGNELTVEYETPFFMAGGAWDDLNFWIDGELFDWFLEAGAWNDAGQWIDVAEF